MPTPTFTEDDVPDSSAVADAIFIAALVCVKFAERLTTPVFTVPVAATGAAAKGSSESAAVENNLES